MFPLAPCDLTDGMLQMVCYVFTAITAVATWLMSIRG